jgi:tetratricopeptide (TPR) repeat protein
MCFNKRQILYLTFLSVLILSTACGSKNPKVDANDIITNDSTDSVVLKGNDNDTVQNAVADIKGNPNLANSKTVSGENLIRGMGPGLRAANKTINQSSLEKIFPKKADQPKEITDGLKLAAGGNLTAAVSKFDEAIALDSKNADAYFYRAKAEIELKLFDKAMVDINNAILLNPHQAIFYYYRGKLYSDSRKQDMAIADFDNAIKYQPNFPDAYNYRGVSKALQDRHSDALADYETAIKDNPKYAILYYNKGTSEASLKRYDEAITTFSKCIELDGSQIKAYHNRGNCRLIVKDYDGAIADFNKVISANPQNGDVYFNRGYAKYLGKKEGMCEDWRKALNLGRKEAAKMIQDYCK